MTLNFDENVHCDHVREFWRPCRGLSTWKGASPVKRNYIWPVETEGNTFLEVVAGKIVQQKYANFSARRCHFWKVI